MRKIKELIFASVCLLGMTVAVSSCVEPGPDGPDKPAITGSTIMLPNEANAVVEVTLDMKSDWNVSNANTWFTVQPLSGVAGQATFTITVLDTNPELTEKVASFRINEGDTPTEYFVVQDVMPGIAMEQKSCSVGGSASEISFIFSSNVDVDVVSDADWITVGAISKDSVLLADNATYSKLKTYTVSLEVASNEGDIRNGNVMLTQIDGDISENFKVSQMGEFAIDDWNTPFKRRSLAFRFTSTSCGYCPIMAAAMAQTYEETDGRFIPFTLYANSSSWMPSGGGLAYDGTDEFETFFKTQQSYPTGVTNGYANLGNYNQNTQVKIYKELVEEAITELPSNCAIGGTVMYSDGYVNASIAIAAKKAGEYTVGVYLMENGIIYNQASGGSDYEHNFVVRNNFTDNIMGDKVTLEAQSIAELNFNMPLPSSVENVENCYVCVWVAYDGTFTGNVSEPNGGKLYVDYGMVIDNVVNIPVNGFSIFEYEN